MIKRRQKIWSGYVWPFWASVYMHRISKYKNFFSLQKTIKMSEQGAPANIFVEFP